MLLVASPENQLLKIQEKIDREISIHDTGVRRSGAPVPPDHLDSNILLLTRAISLRTAQKHKRYV